MAIAIIMAMAKLVRTHRIHEFLYVKLDISEFSFSFNAL